MNGSLIPELDVSNLKHSLDFYVGHLGFALLYARPEERFAMLTLQGIRLMLEEAEGPGRRFQTAPLEKPFGRGVNFQIAIVNVDEIHQRALASHQTIVIPLEERWYRRDAQELGNRQFVVADPDGYLLRFCTDLGARNYSAGAVPA